MRGAEPQFQGNQVRNLGSRETPGMGHRTRPLLTVFAPDQILHQRLGHRVEELLLHHQGAKHLLEGILGLPGEGGKTTLNLQLHGQERPGRIPWTPEFPIYGSKLEFPLSCHQHPHRAKEQPPWPKRGCSLILIFSFNSNFSHFLFNSGSFSSPAFQSGLIFFNQSGRFPIRTLA